MRAISKAVCFLFLVVSSIGMAYAGNGDDKPANSPEQSLRECIEYQLFFKTLEIPANASTEDYKDQKAGFDALGLSDRDAHALADTLATFRDRYSELEQSFEQSSKHDTQSAIDFSKQVDKLVDGTKANLESKLSPQGLKAIQTVINRDEELKRRADQYVRWRGLREMQATNESKSKEGTPSGHN